MVPVKYREYCEDESRNSLPAGLFYEYRIVRRLSYTAFPRFQSEKKFQLELDALEVRQKWMEEETVVEVNSITAPLFRNLVPRLSPDLHLWMDQMNRYLIALSVADKFALMAMTRFSQFHVQEWLLKGSAHTLHQRLASWNRLAKLRGYLPIFFPICDQIDAGVIVLNPQQTRRWQRMTSVRTRYRFVLETVAPTLSYEETVECVRLLAEQVVGIVNGAPPTKSKMVLYRGVKTDHMPGKAFVSTSLNPFHTVRYMENAGRGSCCMMRITVPRGSRIVFLAGFSPFEGEQEFLLPPAHYEKTKEEMVIIPNLDSNHDNHKKKTRCPERGKRVRIIDLDFQR